MSHPLGGEPELSVCHSGIFSQLLNNAVITAYYTIISVADVINQVVTLLPTSRLKTGVQVLAAAELGLGNLQSCLACDRSDRTQTCFFF